MSSSCGDPSPRPRVSHHVLVPPQGAQHRGLLLVPGRGGQVVVSVLQGGRPGGQVVVGASAGSVGAVLTGPVGVGGGVS